MIVVFVPYFGKFPNHMGLFLKSCESNPEFTFIIFSDQDSSKYIYPDNVRFVDMTFHELQELASKKIGQNMVPFSPYKLCDYKPAYGRLFEDYAKDADYWGFCDIDLIWGRITDFLSIETIYQYDKIQTQGHFTLYKNTGKMNSLFMCEVPHGINFKKVTSIKEPCFFDEIFVPVICKIQKIKQYDDWRFADILPQFNDFVIAPTCDLKNKKGQYFIWENGKLLQCANNNRERTAVMYLHLQKRPLKVFFGDTHINNGICITPKGIWFLSSNRSVDFSENEEQSKNYKIKRWKGFTLRKVWIHYKIHQALSKNNVNIKEKR